jgi:predicted nucleic acid-binding protein
LILVDTNVLVDIVSDDPLWAEWSQRHLTIAAAQDEVAINDIVYAELSVRYATIEELEAMIREARLVSASIPRPALFLAGKAFHRYRSAVGKRTGVLPDFFLGAHAVVSDCALMTRDAARYRTYFPGIMLIAPN